MHLKLTYNLEVNALPPKAFDLLAEGRSIFSSVPLIYCCPLWERINFLVSLAHVLRLVIHLKVALPSWTVLKELRCERHEVWLNSQKTSRIEMERICGVTCISSITRSNVVNAYHGHELNQHYGVFKPVPGRGGHYDCQMLRIPYCLDSGLVDGG
jgi:hypothetical protein